MQRIGKYIAPPILSVTVLFYFTLWPTTCALDDVRHTISNLLFFVISKLVFNYPRLQLISHPIKSGRTESAFRERSYWKARSHRLLEFKTAPTAREKSIPTLWSPTYYCELKGENSLSLFTLWMQMFIFFSIAMIFNNINSEFIWVFVASDHFLPPLQFKIQTRMFVEL